MMPPASWDKILHIVEIHEKILSFLPPDKILRCQQVSRHWQEVIKSSSTLQKQLFLKAGEPRYVCEHMRFNTFGMPVVAVMKLYKKAVSYWEPKQTEMVISEINDELLRHHPYTKPEKRASQGFSPTYDWELRHKATAYWDKSDQVHTRLDMFLTQPPETAVMIKFRENSRLIKSHSNFVTSVVRKEGVRLRDVLKRIHEVSTRSSRRQYKKNPAGSKCRNVRICLMGEAEWFKENGVIFLSERERAEARLLIEKKEREAMQKKREEEEAAFWENERQKRVEEAALSDYDQEEREGEGKVMQRLREAAQGGAASRPRS